MSEIGDSYIDFYKSNNKRRKKRRVIRLFFISLLIGGMAGTGFYIINKNRGWLYREHIKEQQTEIVLEQQDNDTNPEPVEIVNQLPTPTSAPSVIPTPVITPKEQNEAVETAGKRNVLTRIPVKVKGIYVTAPVAGMSLRDQLIELADTTEINAMVIDIKDDYGKISYAMNSPMAKEIGALTNTIPDMEQLVALLKEKNIYLIARIVAFKDPYLAESRQELAIKNVDGTLYRDKNGDGWVNPYNREVWDYLVELATQAATIGFDEIQFDYIRFSTDKGISEADFGNEADTVSREEIILEFTKYAYEKIKPLDVFVSADVFGTIISSKIDASLVGQNYVEMAKYLDYICPMIYPSHFGEGNYGIDYPDLEPYNIIRKVLIASKTKLDEIPEGEHRAVVRPWLQDFTASWIKQHLKYGKDEVRAQIDGVYDAGYEEWLLWNPTCVYSEECLMEE